VHAGQPGQPAKGGPAPVAGQVGGAHGPATGEDLERRARPELGGRLLERLGEVAGGDRPAQLAGLVDQHQGDPGDQEQPGGRDQRRTHHRVQRLGGRLRRHRLGNDLPELVLVVLHRLSC
jgi:hypothetical protein